MRLIFLTVPFVALTACAAPQTPQSTATAVPMAAAPVALPMDPGQVSCAQVNANAGYATAAAPWVNGQLRASAIMSGASSAASDTDVATVLTSYCSGNASASVRDAAQWLSAQ